MLDCKEKFPEYQTTQAEEYKQCQQQKANDAWDSKINVGEAELNTDEAAILNEYNKAITLTDQDETDAVNFINKKTTDIFKNAEYYTEGSTHTMVGPQIKKRNEDQIKKYLKDSGYTYEQYLSFKENGSLPEIEETDIEEEKNIIIKNKKRDFLENVDSDLRIGVEQKLIRQQDIARKALDTNKFLQNQIVQVNDKGDLTGGELFDISSEMRRMTFSLNKSRDDVKPQISSIQKRVDDAATFTNSEGVKITDINKKIEFLKNQLSTNEDGTPKNTPSNKIFINQINNSIKLYNTGSKKIAELSQESEPSAQFFKDYNNLATKRDNLIENYESLVNEQIAGMESNSSAMDAINVWKRSYENMDQLWTATQSMVNDVVLAGAEVGEFVTQAFRGVPGIIEYTQRANSPEIKSSSNLVNYFRSVRNQSIDNSQYLNNVRENKLPETIKLSEIRNSDDFINYSMDAVMNNIPQTAMAFAGPAVATGWFTLSGLGNKAGEVGLLERKYQGVDFEALKSKYESETDPFEKMFLESEIKAYDKAMNTNQITKFLAFTTHGLAESIPARMFGSIKIAQGVKDVYKFVPKNSLGKTGFKVLSAFGAPVSESIEEGFTNTLQNLNARYMLGEDVSIFDNLDEAMAQGFIIGKGFTAMQTAPNIYGALLNVSQTKQDKKIIKNKTNELNQILDNLNNPDLNKNLTKKGAKQLKQKANDLVSEIVTAGDVSLDKLSKLSFLEITALGNVDKKMNNIQTRYVQAKKAGLQPESLKIIKKDLQAEYDILQNQKADILGKETRVDEQLEDSRIVQASAQVDSLVKKAETEVEFDKKLETGKKILGDDLVIIDENTDLSKLDITSEQADSIGFEEGGKVYINPTKALDSGGNVNVVAHEILHVALNKYVATSEGLNAIESFYKGLDQQSKNAIDNELKSRGYVSQDSKDIIKGLKDGDFRVDEILTQYLDLVDNKDSNIDIKTGTLQQINDFIVNFLNAIIPGKKAKFKTAGDVRRFLIDYKNKFKTGELKIDTGTETDASVDSNKTLSKALSTNAGNINALAVDMAKKGYDNLTTSEINTIKDQYTNVALAAIKYDVGKGTIKQADAQAFVDAEFATIARNYRARNPKTNKKQDFTTYIYNTVGRRGANLYGKQEGLAEAGKTTSIDSPQARQVADTSSDFTTTPEVVPTLDVMKFAKQADSSIDIKQFDKDFTDSVNKLAKEKGIDITNPNLTSKQLQEITPYNVLAKAIGIPANKLSNPKDNLSKGESLKAQRLLLAAKPFIKNVVLGQANKQVGTVASKKKGGKPVKVGGETLGLGRNILNKFFNPPKRVGNNQVRTPKKFENSVYEAAIGVKDGKVDPNYVPRASESQIIKGLLKSVAEQMANKGARNILSTKTQTSNVVMAKANLERGKNPKVLSKTKLENHAKKHKFSSYAPNEGEIDTDGVYKNTKKYAEDIIKIINSGKFPPGLLNKGTFMNRALWGGSKKRSKVQQKSYDFLSKKLDSVKALKKTDPRYAKTKASSLIKEDFTGTFNDIISWFANPKNNIKAYNKRNSGMFDDGWNAINKILNGPNGKEFAPAIYWMLNSTTTERAHFHALAEVVSYNVLADPTAKVEWEHAVQSTTAYNFLFDAALDSKVNFPKALKALKRNYKIIGITKQQNQLITDAGYKNDMPKINGKDFDIYKDSWVERYTKTPGLDLTSQDWVAEGVNVYGKQNEVFSKAINKVNKTLSKGKIALNNDPNLKPELPNPVKLDADINNIIQDTKGIKAKYRFSDIVAKRRGAKVRNFKLISSGAQDFQGLMYDLYGKGRKGEQQQKWVQDNLVKPYQKGIADIDKYRQALKNDYSTLLKQNPEVAKKLGKIVPGTEFTFDQALRVNLWTRAGFEIPGLAKRDVKKLNSVVTNDPQLNLFNDAALLISKRDKWIEPSAYWDSESLISDLNGLTEKVGRKQYLASFIENADVIFSKENLNKMEVALGTNWREAMEDSLYRMKNGTNRPSGTNKLTNQFNNWVNNSIGAIMFFNRKSALLQTISSVNFLNWSDNNPFKAAVAFGNQPQYWKDFATLWNSPKLKQRRSGLRKDVNEAELANAAKGALNKPQAILSYLLKIGFTPTQLADSFAIASGGATFYRNRLNTYKKQGLSEQEASDKAFEDFSATSDVSQQSADPMLISQQQASILGRLLLAFQNTPAQVTRIFNKSARDFINGRGDQKTNVSKMIYYGAIQGMIFATLQNALFATIPGFSDEEDEEKKKQTFDKKGERIVNSMVDTMLRGSGVYGAIVATLKNTIMTYFKEEKKDAFGKDHRNTLLEALNLSPPVGSKLRKINNAIKAKDYNKEVIEEQGWDVTLKGRVNLSPSYQVVASLAEAITNLPLERAVVEIDAIVETLDARNTTFQRIALALGYRTWDVGTKNEERDLVKIESKEAKEKARKQKVIDDRAERKRLKELEKYKGKTKEEIKQMKRRDSIVDTNKSDQITSLKNLGLTTKQIKELKYEDDRVNKIIELTNK